MKRTLCLFFIIVLCYLGQTAVFPFLQLANVTPNLLLIVVVAIGYIRGKKEGMFWGLFCGLLLDCQYGQILGVNAFLYLLIGYAVGVCNKVYYRDNSVLPIVLVLIGDFAYSLLYYMMMFLLRNRTNLLFYARRIMLPEAVYTVLVSILIYKCIHNLLLGIEDMSRKES